jgi:hypothetical protein
VNLAVFVCEPEKKTRKKERFFFRRKEKPRITSFDPAFNSIEKVKRGHRVTSAEWRWKVPFWSSLSDPTGTSMNKCKSTTVKVCLFLILNESLKK